MEGGEVLYEQGYSAAPFFVIISGELEVVRPSVPVETIVTVYEPGQFTGEVGILSGRRSLFRVRATKPGKVIELNRQQVLALIQTDAELGEILMRAFILRRVELIAAGVGRVNIFFQYASDQRVSDAQWTAIFLYGSGTRH
jgi:thioredoxin reductase (NADPH)